MGAVHLGALAVFAAGCVQLIEYCMLVVHVDGFEHMARMVAVDEGSGGSGSLGLAVYLCIAAAVLTTVVGAVGCLGNQCESKASLCCYFLTTAGLTVFYLGVTLYAYTLGSSIIPLMVQQGAEFCNTTLNFAYETHLDCNDNSVLTDGGKHVDAFADKVLLKCGGECRSRLELIREMGGCRYLMSLCHAYDYAVVGQGFCLLADPNGSQYLAPTIPSNKSSRVSEDCCLKACDSVVGCSGFTYEPSARRCFLLAPHRPFIELPEKCSGVQWEMSLSTDITLWLAGRPTVAGAAGGEGVLCFEKGGSTLLSSIKACIGALALFSGLAGLVLLSATACACCQQYTLSTRRKGRKGPAALATRMLCPCLEQRTPIVERNDPSKLAIVSGEDSEEDSESE